MRCFRPLAGIIGSGSEPHSSLSVPLGEYLARNGYSVINGGGNGVMKAVARGFTNVESRAGIMVGVLPSARPCTNPDERKSYRPPSGYPNPYIELEIRTHLPLSGSRGKEVASRNHIIVLSADFLVALPGAEGTRSEIELALEYRKPIILLSPDGEWDQFAQIAKVVRDLNAVFHWIEELHLSDQITL